MSIATIVGHKICVFIFSTTLSETFPILRKIQQDIVVNVRRSLLKYPLFLSEFDDTQIVSTDFQTIKFNENPFSGSRVVLRGRTHRQTE